MAFRIRIHPEVNKEMSSGYDWYEIRSEGRGADFFDKVDDTIRRILERPKLFPAFEENLRKASVKGYPYNVFYFEEDEIIYIQGVLHHKQSYKKMLKRKFM